MMVLEANFGLSVQLVYDPDWEIDPTSLKFFG